MTVEGCWGLPYLDTEEESTAFSSSPLGSSRKLQGRWYGRVEGANGGVNVDVTELRPVGPPE